MFVNWCRHYEDIGGVRMWVQKDNVQGLTFYYHPDHDRSSSFKGRGIFPYIGHASGETAENPINGKPTEYYLKVLIQSGRTSHADLGHSVTLNVQGVVLTRERGIEVKKSESWFGDYYAFVSFSANQEWVTALKGLGTAKIAVVRFTGKSPSTRWYRDYKVSKWNKRCVADVMKAFDYLLEREPPVPEPALEPPVSSNALRLGPLSFLPDGSITDQPGSLRLPPGVRCSELSVGDATLSYLPNGDCVVTVSGVRHVLRFAGGRWDGTKAATGGAPFDAEESELARPGHGGEARPSPATDAGGRGRGGM